MKNTLIKKGILAVVATTFLFTSIAPVSFASSMQPQENTSSKSVDPTKSKYSYTYDGVEIRSTVELDENQLKFLYSQTKNMSINSSMVNPSIIDQGSPGMTVAGPEYVTYENFAERKIADLLVSATVGKLKWVKNLGTMSSWVYGVVNGWGLSKIIHPTYVGSWITKSYNNNSGLYDYFLTVVYYTNNSYNQPIKVEYNLFASKKE